jgi:uncharacterized protein YuzB (UPF0349 family)
MAERFLVCPPQMANAVITLRNTEIERSNMMRLGATSMPNDPIDITVRGGLAFCGLCILQIIDLDNGNVYETSGRLRHDEQAVR